MTDRHTLRLTPGARQQAHQWLDRALSLWQPGSAWVMELREAKRSDEQNAALHGLIGQIMKQRTHLNGVKMDMALWKATFLHALGEEVRFTPTLEGDGVFPLGLRTSALSKARFSELIEYILWWCAKEGLTVQHFGPEHEAANDTTGQGASRAA
ncbi:recombination protein NinB [Brevundimonas sp.]|uniref:recombination protein NinB n=1 Tax=Brevundimonas sp. TaxID=1871086 RepID=UPI002D2E1333|nr:recombination protein NinB [Brevundimonas sp.]HYC66683.1 recombination protein NinB [Brevundimonas sp.]